MEIDGRYNRTSTNIIKRAIIRGWLCLIKAAGGRICRVITCLDSSALVNSSNSFWHEPK